MILFFLVFNFLLAQSIFCFENPRLRVGEYECSLSDFFDTTAIRSKCRKNLKVKNLTTCSRLCANNATVNNLCVKNIINAPSYLCGNARFVDPVNGSDNNNGGIASPYRTITKALSSISDNSEIRRYAIILFPGLTTEPSAINWKPFVSLFGFGKDACIINQDINYIAGSQEVSAMNFMNIQVLNGNRRFNIDASAAAEVVIRIICCRCNATWNGGGPFTVSNINLLLFEANTQVLDCLVIDGVVGSTASAGFFKTLTINNGTSPIVQMVGGFLSDGLVVTLNGNANLITRGVLNRAAAIIGIAVGSNIPQWNTDATSMTPLMVNTGPNLAVIEADEIIVTTTANIAITKEKNVLIDAASGPLVVSLPPASSYVGRAITIKKTDASVNAVDIQAFTGDLIDGATSRQLIVQYQFISIFSNGISWSIIGN